MNTTRASNSLDPNQARHFVGPDLGPNCLQRLLADGTVGKELSAHMPLYHLYQLKHEISRAVQGLH